MSLLDHNNVTEQIQYSLTNIPDYLKNILYTAIYSVIGVSVCTFGIITNVANIVVFAKQGFQETVIVTLFAMAISDLMSVITLLWVGICVNPLFKYSNIPFMSEGVHFLTGSWPHAICVRITGWLTAVVTVERCLSVIFPFKIKSLVTLKRVKILVVAIFILCIGSMSPTFVTTRLGWRFVPSRNRTMIAVYQTADKSKIDSVATFVHSTAPSIVYFILISASTIMLVISLQRQAQWRQESTSVAGDNQNQMAVRDRKIIKMVVTLAAIFIACLLPHMIVILSVANDPEFSVIGKRSNAFKVYGSLALTMEAVNSSVNIFIYYNMSSKYKQIFRAVFLRENSKPQ